jgi:hypothetical protein
MYRCAICDKLSEPNQPRLLHTIYRKIKTAVKVVTGRSITLEGRDRVHYEAQERSCKEPAVEMPVCKSCHDAIEEGGSLPKHVIRDSAAPEYKLGPPRPKPVLTLMIPPTRTPHRTSKKQQRADRLAAMEGKIVQKGAR